MIDDPSSAPAHVSCSTSDGVATVAIDDGKANALGHPVLAGLEAALDRAEDDADAKVLVVVGREGKFSAGFDLAVMTSGVENARDMLLRGAELALRLLEFPKPVVFGVTGHALAMGGILLCAADVRVGAEGSFKLGLPEVRIGMPVPSFAAELCRDRLSPRWFNRAVHLGQTLSPAGALDAGLLDELVPADRVAQRAHECAVELAEAVHPAPFRLTRTIIRAELASRLREAMERDRASFSVEPG